MRCPFQHDPIKNIPRTKSYRPSPWRRIRECDTIHVGLNELTNSTSNLFVFYDASWQKTFINADKLKGRNYQLTVYDITGRKIIDESGKLDSPYFTRDLEMNGYAQALYIITLTTEKGKLVKRFIKN